MDICICNVGDLVRVIYGYMNMMGEKIFVTL